MIPMRKKLALGWEDQGGYPNTWPVYLRGGETMRVRVWRAIFSAKICRREPSRRFSCGRSLLAVLRRRTLQWYASVCAPSDSVNVAGQLYWNQSVQSRHNRWPKRLTHGKNHGSSQRLLCGHRFTNSIRILVEGIPLGI